MAEQKQDVTAELKKIATSPVKIIGISGSLRKASFNTGILRYLKEAKLEGVEFEIVSIADLPLFNQDLENAKDESQEPKSVQELRSKIRGADAIFFSCPEYNYGISSPMKNALDWASRGANGSALKGKWCVYIILFVYIFIYSYGIMNVIILFINSCTVVGAGGGAGTARAQIAFRQSSVFLELKMITKPECCVKAFEPEKDTQAPPVDFASGDLKSDKWKKRLVAQMHALRDFARKDKMGEVAFKSLCSTPEKK